MYTIRKIASWQKLFSMLLIKVSSVKKTQIYSMLIFIRLLLLLLKHFKHKKGEFLLKRMIKINY